MRNMPSADPTVGDLIEPAGLMALDDGSGKMVRVRCDADGNLLVGLSGGDIEIGAVELKDGTTDTRAKIGAGTALVPADNALAVKNVGIPVAPTVVSGTGTASVAEAVIADTGNLAAGSYRVEITMGHSGVSAAGKHLVAEHRNAADSATNHTLGICPSGGAIGLVLDRVEVAANESIRVKMGAVAAAASEVAQAMIRAYLLS